MAVDLEDWIGRTETARDILTPGLVQGLNATLDRDSPYPEPGCEAPQGIHWLLAQPRVAQSRIGPDGHPERGDFLPPVALPRRMWAASRVDFLAPLRVGDDIERTSTVAAVTDKEGRSGALVFVEVDHVTRAGETPAVSERQTIVYRQAGGNAGSPRPGPGGDWEWRRQVTPDAVLLFRYSALTFNAHRIHYDLDFATRTEGYPGLIVHGPLTATLLLDLAARKLGGNALAHFRFRGVSPAFSGAPLTLLGRQEGADLSLAAENGEGHPVMTASARVGDSSS
jgi:3-methylfumaryl-CoA hydratase